MDYNTNSIMREYTGAVKAAAARVPEFHSKLMQVGDLKGLLAQVLCNLKTHKEAGKVYFRVVHANSKYHFSILGTFLSLMIRP